MVNEDGAWKQRIEKETKTIMFPNPFVEIFKKRLGSNTDYSEISYQQKGSSRIIFSDRRSHRLNTE